MVPSYRFDFKQHRLKSPSGTTRTWIVASKLLDKFFVAVDNSEASFYLGFGRITFTAFTAALERKAVLGLRFSWCASVTLGII
jgi:hypothetical protein